MLGKLFKYEWKDLTRIGLMMIIGVAIVTGLGLVYFQTPLWKNLFNDAMNSATGIQAMALIITAFGGFFLYVMTIAAAIYGMMIYEGVHFYKTMYTDEGYLTHTLPAKTGQILFAKFAANGLWMLLVSALSVLSVLFLALNGVQALANASGEDMHIFREIFGMIRDNWEDMGDIFIKVAVYGIASAVVGVFAEIGVIFGSSAIGQLSRKHKGLMAVLTYFIIMIIGVILSTVASFFTTASGRVIELLEKNGRMVVDMSMNLGIILSLAQLILFYVICYVINKKKLNLD